MRLRADVKKAKSREPRYEVVVVGGAGHVGAPLSIVLAEKGFRTLIYDISQNALDTLAKGKLPFLEGRGAAAQGSAGGPPARVLQ